MKILKLFNDYRIDKILEYMSYDLTIKDGALPFYISDNLRYILLNINHPIASLLVATSLLKTYKKQTMLDVVYGEPDKFYFIMSNKIIDEISKNIEIKGDSDFDEYTIRTSIELYKNEIDKYKVKIKIGRLINKLFPKEFKPNGEPGEDIESFMNEYSVQITKDYKLFDIVEGKKIIHFYNEKQIAPYKYKSTLTGSCMVKDRCTTYLEFYAINSPTIRMIVLYNEKDKTKIDARALLWELSEIEGKKVKNKYFVDRIYYNSNDHLNKFISYIKSKGFLYKSKQNLDERYPIYGYKEGEAVEIDMVATGIKYPKSLEFPYLDTLYNYNPYEGIITNVNKPKNYHKFTGLWDTYGGSDVMYSKKYDEVFVLSDKEWIKDYITKEYIKKIDAFYISIYKNFTHKENIDKDFVESKYHESWIPKNNSKYLEKYKDWILKKNLHKEFGWVYDSFVDEWLKTTDAIWSERLDTYVDIKNHIRIYYDHRKETYLISIKDDPMEDYYKYKGDYYFNEVKKEHIKKYNEINKKS